MSEIYKYLEKDNSKVKVESANRDGNGTQIDTNYAKQDGDYSEVGLVSALATNFKTNRGQTSTYPFTFAPSGIVSGSQYADLMTGVQKINSLRGNSVAWNQLAQPRATSQTETRNGITITDNRDGSFTISGTATDNVLVTLGQSFTSVANHIYLLKGCPSGGSNATYRLIESYTYILTDIGNGSILTLTSSGTKTIALDIKSGTTINNLVFRPQLFDLTLMFGAGNEPTTVVDFNNLFPKPYYEYNAGELLSCQSNKLVSVGYNQFDGELEIGYLNDTTGQPLTNNANVIPKNYIRVDAGQTYTLEAEDTTNRNRIFYEYDDEYNLVKRTVVYYPTISLTLTNNTHYVKFVYPNPDVSLQIAFHLTWSGSKTGFEAHYKHEYDLPNVELRSAGSVYDELTPDGKLTRRIGVVDLGTLDWGKTTVGTSTDIYAFYTLSLSGLFAYHYGLTNYFVCSKYMSRTAANIQNNQYEGIAMWSAGQVRIYDSSKQSMTANEFKSAMSGVYLFYELATPTEETTTTFEEYFYADDYGTLEFESEQTLQVPQGYEILYPLAMNDFLGRLMQRTDVNSSPTNLVSQSELANYLKTLSGYSASKTQTLKNVNGTLQWVDD